MGKTFKSAVVTAVCVLAMTACNGNKDTDCACVDKNGNKTVVEAPEDQSCADLGNNQTLTCYEDD